LEELNKYQDNLENIIEQSQDKLKIKMEAISDDLNKFKEQCKRDRRTDEANLR
jgi:hypothetical protein